MGMIRGVVRDGSTMRPIAGAVVRLDVPGGAAVQATTDAGGAYAMAIPPMPEFFALSASAEGYLPESVNVASADIAGQGPPVDFSLSPVTERVVAVEERPIVHHIGNDLFEGSINSRFQKASEGTFFATTFELRAGQLSPAARSARVVMLARGVQCPHKIRINGRTLETRMEESPEDGSFGEFTAAFDPLILQPGTNSFVIRGVSCRGDRDDFEFVNVRLVLSRE
jgi:hypothetical protein